MTSKPFLGRCRTCKYTIFAAAEDIQDVKSFSDVKPGLAYRVEGRTGVFSRCNQGHTVFPLKQIKGTYSKDHNCDSRCLNAKGWECTCSCGGANHGRGHAVTVHEAGAPEPEKRFLGEFGKHIKGKVRVVGKKPTSNGKILFTFETLDETAVIKWFAPLDHEDDFEPEQEATIRAKVMRHEEEYGMATIVIYVERINNA